MKIATTDIDLGGGRLSPEWNVEANETWWAQIGPFTVEVYGGNFKVRFTEFVIREEDGAEVQRGEGVYILNVPFPRLK